jgi:hypothetical protein
VLVGQRTYRLQQLVDASAVLGTAVPTEVSQQRRHLAAVVLGTRDVQRGGAKGQIWANIFNRSRRAGVYTHV